jgi:type IV pilus assembly protein PilB
MILVIKYIRKYTMNILDILNNQKNNKDRDEQLKTIYDDSRERNTEIKADGLGLPYIDLKKVNIEIDALGLIDENAAKEFGMVCFQIKNKQLAIAILDNTENTSKVIKDFEKQEYEVKLFVCSISSLKYAFGKYSLVAKTREVITDVLEIGSYTNISFKDLGDMLNQMDENNISLINATIFKSAILAGVSDVHISPKETEAVIKFRIDGVLFDVANISNSRYLKLRDRIKLLARLKLNIQDGPQDGRFTIKDNDQDYQSRASAIPSLFGEILVMRILSQKAIALSLKDLGLDEDEVKLMEGVVSGPNGMVLVTGPTGSGKTTTLYSILKEKNKPGVNIITIEDPIEYQMKGINQTQVDEKRGYGFQDGLKSILRQDPDTIMVGEIRDKETANIAIQASLTGHLVLSTLHTNESAGTIARLMEFDIENDIIASSLKLIISQRLVRKLCPYCKEEYIMDDETQEEIKKAISILSPKSNFVAPKEIKKIYRPKGCPKCNNLGYKGQVGIFELLFINDDINELIKNRNSIAEIREIAIKDGMVPLFHDGLAKVLRGETSLDELIRVSGDIEYVALMFDKLLKQSLLRGIEITKDEETNALSIINNLPKLEDLINNQKSADAFELICIMALIFKASDIHIEPEEKEVKVRYRIDGVLLDKLTMSVSSYLGVMQYLKDLILIDDKNPSLVSEGRFKIKTNGQSKDVRVSVVPSGFGESVVMRLLKSDIAKLELTDLGLYPEMLPTLKQIISRPNGIVLACGPTSSGKTTTMYSILTSLNTSDVKIMTVEDPIEYQMKGIVQTQVDEKMGYTFSEALKSFLRQNPNIILVGEIRDEETAKVAVQASLTGHLILSTIHTIDSVGAISRLENFGIKSQELSASFSGAISQRLVRKLCPYCKEEIQLEKDDSKYINGVLESMSPEMKKKFEFRLSKDKKIFKEKGCEKCNFTGFNGQVGLFEILSSDSEIEGLIANNADSLILKKELLERSLNLEQDGVMKVIEGVTTLGEIRRVVGGN